MKDYDFIVTVITKDGKKKDFLSEEEVTVGTTINGCEVISCRSISKKFEE